MGQTAIKSRHIFIIVGSIVVVLVIIAIAVPLSIYLDDDDDNDGGGHGMRMEVDCFPEAGGDPTKVDKDECSKRGCLYNPSPGPNLLGCVYQDGKYGISVDRIEDNGVNGLMATLNQVGQAPFRGDIKAWKLSVKCYGDTVLRFSFEPAQGERYKVPIQLDLGRKTNPSASTSAFQFVITDKKNLGFKVIRKSTGTAIWETPSRPGSVVLSDQFLQIQTLLPSTYVYGLGEHSHPSFRHNLTRTWSSFSRDQPPPWDEEANLYGVHPFYTCVEDDTGNTHGVFMFNSNAQEYAFTDEPSLTFRTIGGVLDMYVFLGPTPENVVQQYTAVIGRPMLPPYWSLGFQLCRYGYNNISHLVDAVESTKQYDIPHDVQYVDIDHMDTRNIFTIDQEKFPGLNDYFETLRDGGMSIIYILDPCVISNLTNFEPYEKLVAVNGNVLWSNPASVPSNYSDDNGALLGYVWPQGPVAFPDYFKPETQDVWHDLIVNHSKSLVFDGLWIDMNEPASFGTNEERPWNWPEEVKPYFSLHCPSSRYDDPPYRTKAAYRWDNPKTGRKSRLSDKTICLETLQGPNGQFRHYDVHSLYGYSQTEPTLRATRTVTGGRGLVFSRSTFPGSGRYSGHWLGDNASQWKDLRRSIIGMLEFNLFGIPYVGADICGFFDDTTVQLCKRWMQLGAFYPYCRNHNGIDFMNQGPGQLGDEVGEASRDILRERYRLLPYLYLLFHLAHVHGSTVVRSLLHEFPQDLNTRTIDTQFMWGSCLLISPILYEDQTELTFYLPQGRWYEYLSPDKFAYKDQEKGGNHTVAVRASDMPWVHLRAGCVLVLQGYANNTHFSRQQPLQILAALDKDGRASGSFFWDDGKAVVDHDDYKFYLAVVNAQNNTVTWNVTSDPFPRSWPTLTFEELTLLGVTDNVTKAEVTQYLVGGISISKKETFVQRGHVLTINLNPLELLEVEGFTATWS